MGVVDAVDLEEILEEHEDEVGEEARLLAEIGVLEELEDLGREVLEEFVILEDVAHAEFAHLFAEALARLHKDVGLEARVHVVLQVDGVELADLHEHADVVLILGVLLRVRVQQVLVLFQILDDLAVHLLVLEGAVQDDQDLRVDRPVVQVRDVPLEDELERANRTHLLLVLAVQTLE